MSLLEARGPELFPVLGRAQVETARRFASGEARSFAPGAVLYDVGERAAPAWLVLEGTLELVRRDGLHPEAPITTLGAGQFSGEIRQLSGRARSASSFRPADSSIRPTSTGFRTWLMRPSGTSAWAPAGTRSSK